MCILEVVAPPMRSGIFMPAFSISFATVTISSKDGVIKPERPKMSASLSLTAFKMSSHGHMAPISTTLKLLQPNTTATMFLPMSCTSPFTVAIKKVPAVDASVLPVAAFSASMSEIPR